MEQTAKLKLLFVINPGSGNHRSNWAEEITNYFSSLPYTIELHHLTKACNRQTIKDKIAAFAPQQVIAVGGDGTVKLVAECLLQKNIALGILPAGSANGLAKELGISHDPIKALDVIVKGHTKKIHAINVNDHLCIHLSDIGFNAYVVEKFENKRIRGMWGYVIASLKVLGQNPRLEIDMQVDQEVAKIRAEMIVIANATKYGSGALINPIGRLDDKLFEVIVVKKVSVRELFKMVFSHAPYDLNKTEVFQTTSLQIKSSKKVYFQVDGEYFGKVKAVKAVLIPAALKIIVPAIE